MGSAIVNEWKGHLFEYSVAHQLAKILKQEALFLESLSLSQQKNLQEYEKGLRNQHPYLAKNLWRWGRETAEAIHGFFPVLEKVELLGKIQGEKQHGADLYGWLKGKPHAFSLKLGKGGGQVFTKNTGVKSFLTKYFTPFSSVNKDQQELNTLMERAFMEMSLSLYQEKETEEWKLDLKNWQETGEDSLPGKLPAHLREKVLQFYEQVANHLFQKLHAFFCQDKELFKRQVIPLCGFPEENSWQIQAQVYPDDSLQVKILSATEILEQSLLMMTQEGATISIKWDLFLLRLRVKPSDQFTTAGFKVIASMENT